MTDFMLSVANKAVILSVFLLSVFMLSVFMLNVVVSVNPSRKLAIFPTKNWDIHQICFRISTEILSKVSTSSAKIIFFIIENFKEKTCGLYYKPMTIVNDDTMVVNKLEASITDETRVVIYDHHMFIVQATEVQNKSSLLLRIFW